MSFLGAACGTKTLPFRTIFDSYSHQIDEGKCLSHSHFKSHIQFLSETNVYENEKKPKKYLISSSIEQVNPEAATRAFQTYDFDSSPLILDFRKIYKHRWMVQ